MGRGDGGPRGVLRRRPDVRAARWQRQHAERDRRLHVGAVHGRERRGAAGRVDDHRRQRRDLGRRAATPPTCRHSRAPTTSVPKTCRSRRCAGAEYLYVATTTTNEVYRLDLKRSVITVFANRSHDRPGHRRGGRFSAGEPRQPRHRSRGQHLHHRGPQRRHGRRHLVCEGCERRRRSERRRRRPGRWASNGTVGSEFTGLYFDPTDKRRAWVNIQHPASGNDRTIEITIP